MPTTVDIKSLPEVYSKNILANTITDMWVRWNAARETWLTEKKELREYIFATDTRKTTNSKLPWKNSTVTPKLTQIRDNLHANYIAALFPSEDWFVWESADQDSASIEKSNAITNYMKNKMKASGFELTISQLIYDYIDYGNVFAGHEAVNISKVDEITGVTNTVYRGPRAFRISPLDIVFDPTACSFNDSPMIIRRVKSIGDIEKDIAEKPTLQYDKAVFDVAKDFRKNFQDYTDILKSEGMIVDGFGSIDQYLQSGMVEILELWGDIYDCASGTMHRNRIVTIIDRRFVLRNIPNPAWDGGRPIKHCGWRLRPDNLWAQGPLDQLVGMQYRIDHLENLKADVFDQIAHPVVIIYGDTVEDFKWGPGEVCFAGTEGKVEVLRPDATALNADLQIEGIMNRMEELAGAPKQAMGIRTPGEKTKYEVQTLENAAGRIFQSKVNWFERNILEPLLNSMLEEARRTLEGVETVRTVDQEFGTEQFLEVTRDDITAKGKLYPMGARHFAEQAKFVQELTQTMQAVQQIPQIAPHISGVAAAKALEDALGWNKYGIVRKNVAVAETAETQRLASAAQEQVAVEEQMQSDLTEEDMAMMQLDRQLQQG